MTRKILVVGDSHTQSVKRAKKRKLLPKDNITIEVYTLSKEKNGKIIGDISIAEAKKLVSDLHSDDVFVSMIGGNQHNAIGLIQHPRRFDVFSKEQTNNDSNIESIPYMVMKDVFNRGLRGNDGLRLRELSSSATCHLIHAAAPPPKEDIEHILQKHETDFAKRGILEKGISPVELRLTLWNIQMQVTKEICDELGVIFLDFPKDALNENGCLSKKYYADDATHANEQFGALLISKICKILNEITMEWN